MSEYDKPFLTSWPIKGANKIVEVLNTTDGFNLKG